MPLIGRANKFITFADDVFSAEILGRAKKSARSHVSYFPLKIKVLMSASGGRLPKKRKGLRSSR